MFETLTRLPNVLLQKSANAFIRVKQDWKVNMEKTIKVMILGRDLHILQTSGKYFCAECRKGVEEN